MVEQKQRGENYLNQMTGQTNYKMTRGGFHKELRLVSSRETSLISSEDELLIQGLALSF